MLGDSFGEFGLRGRNLEWDNSPTCHGRNMLRAEGRQWLRAHKRIQFASALFLQTFRVSWHPWDTLPPHDTFWSATPNFCLIARMATYVGNKYGMHQPPRFRGPGRQFCFGDGHCAIGLCSTGRGAVGEATGSMQTQMNPSISGAGVAARQACVQSACALSCQNSARSC